MHTTLTFIAHLVVLATTMVLLYGAVMVVGMVVQP